MGEQRCIFTCIFPNDMFFIIRTGDFMSSGQKPTCYFCPLVTFYLQGQFDEEESMKMEEPTLDIKGDEWSAGEMVANQDSGSTEASSGNSCDARKGGNDDACGIEVKWPADCEEYLDIGSGEQLQERKQEASSCETDCIVEK